MVHIFSQFSASQMQYIAFNLNKTLMVKCYLQYIHLIIFLSVKVVDEEAGSQDGDESDAESETGDTPSVAKDLNSSLRLYKGIPLGGASLPKPHVQLKADRHVSAETTESSVKPQIHVVEGHHATQQSDDTVTSKPHLKMVANANILAETQQEAQRGHVRTSQTMSATKESEPGEDNHQMPHLKSREGVQVNMQSTEEREMIPHRGFGQGIHSITRETESEEWLVKKQSRFGHSSQMSSGEPALAAIPRLRKVGQQHANVQSNFKDFSIKPKIRISSTMSASKQTDLDSAGLYLCDIFN